MAKLIRFHKCDFRKTPLPKPPALVALNPGYGERVGSEAALGEVYAAIGDWFKSACEGMRTAVLTGNVELGRRIKLRPSRRVALWNATIECRLLEFEMYGGTRDARLLRKKEGERTSAEEEETT